ncbi:MAG: ParB/RepB/Spo0J family partition protein [Firmicutes bacterium]|nr:ParB/RepB/Spo0J family partition protein [Bacillota bacterium]
MYSFSVYESDVLKYLPVSDIHISPFRARKSISPSYLASLAKSIKNFGILQPVAVRKVLDDYELIFGECRFKAAVAAGLKTVPSVVMSVSDRDSAVLALVENIRRSELDCFEQAAAVADISEDFECGENALSHLLSEDTVYINEQLAINGLEKDIKNQLDGDNKEYASAIVKLKDVKLRREVLGKVKKYGLNIDRTRALIENTLETRKSTVLFDLSMRKKGFEDVKIFLNTVKQAADMLHSCGIDADCEVSKNEKGYIASLSMKTEMNN